jgi:hypothetical protein
MLEEDERFVAAWLTGSIGRGDLDDLSDIDLSVVVGGRHAGQLCRRPCQVGAGTTSERLDVISRLGRPAVIHENHHNAPPAGSFTSCIYADSGVMIDWVFIPVLHATRPHASHLLFDHFGVPVAEPPSPPTDAERASQLSEQSAFFWIMTRPVSKALRRDDLVQFHTLLDALARTVEDVERLLAGEPGSYQRGSRVRLLTSDDERRAFLARLCSRMEALHPEIIANGAPVPEDAPEVARQWFS